jgi:WD40 repeat protein
LLITLGGDNWIKIFDYKDNDREIVSKYIPDGAYAVTGKKNFSIEIFHFLFFNIKGSDPYGFHLCLAMNNRFQLYLITNYELRLMHQYETRSIRDLEMSHSGHLIAIMTNNLIKIYSTVHFNLISQLRGHVGKIKQIIWCKNDSIVISCGTDGMIYIFNIFTGMREGEIITKQFRYIGIAVTNDCNHIYAITSDSSIKIFHKTNLEQEWSIENNFIPSAICLSKSERLLYVGMTHGIIRIYTIPFTSKIYIDLPAHCSSIRRLLVSYDDQYLVSIAESAYILLFRQTINVLNSVSSHYQISQMSIGNLDSVNEQKRIQTMFEYILVTKSEFDEQKRKIKEIQARIK